MTMVYLLSKQSGAEQSLYDGRYWLQNGFQLAKRRRALRERNQPRNSQLETHPDDERGQGQQWSCPHRMERFPYASRNSSSRPRFQRRS